MNCELSILTRDLPYCRLPLIHRAGYSNTYNLLTDKFIGLVTPGDTNTSEDNDGLDWVQCRIKGLYGTVITYHELTEIYEL